MVWYRVRISEPQWHTLTQKYPGTPPLQDFTLIVSLFTLVHKRVLGKLNSNVGGGLTQ